MDEIFRYLFSSSDNQTYSFLLYNFIQMNKWLSIMEVMLRSVINGNHVLFINWYCPNCVVCVCIHKLLGSDCVFLLNTLKVSFSNFKLWSKYSACLLAIISAASDKAQLP